MNHVTWTRSATADPVSGDKEPIFNGIIGSEAGRNRLDLQNCPR